MPGCREWSRWARPGLAPSLRRSSRHWPAPRSLFAEARLPVALPVSAAAITLETSSRMKTVTNCFRISLLPKVASASPVISHFQIRAHISVSVTRSRDNRSLACLATSWVNDLPSLSWYISLKMMESSVIFFYVAVEHRIVLAQGSKPCPAQFTTTAIILCGFAHATDSLIWSIAKHFFPTLHSECRNALGDAPDLQKDPACPCCYKSWLRFRLPSFLFRSLWAWCWCPSRPTSP